ncbi:MAG: hypothetical protein WBA45_08260 [Microthrixaceae bacterium]
MADLLTDVRRVEVEVIDLERQLARLAARLAGKRAELTRLRESVANEQSGGLPAKRTDAIISVLQRDPVAMSPSEVVDALHEAGRTDELRSVTATLAHLMKVNRVLRQGRGRYLAV